VLERIVADWLTSQNERGYQAAFAQMLIGEGHRVLHAPVHHPFEHGKDLVAFAPDGALCAYQLKGGDVGLSDLEAIYGQLLALATTAIGYPGVEPPRRPDQAYLVTNGILTPPARDRLRAMNDGLRALSAPSVGLIEREHLLSRLTADRHNLLPQSNTSLKAFLEVLTADGRGPVPVHAVADLLASTLDASVGTSDLVFRRTCTTAAVATSLLMGPWTREGNHLGIAECWLLFSFAVLRCAEDQDREQAAWEPSLLLAKEAAVHSLRTLLAEATEHDDLVVPDIVDGLVYPSRALLICGFASALLIAQERETDDTDLRTKVLSLLRRELSYCHGLGESSAPHFYVIACASPKLQEPSLGAREILSLGLETIRRNAPNAALEDAIADPYHSVEELLLASLSGPGLERPEDYRRQSYTAHVIIDWLARRNHRIQVEKFWPEITYLQNCEFEVGTPSRLLLGDDDSGRLSMWEYEAPMSWSTLTQEARAIDEASLPSRLWQHLDLLPFLPLIYPQRLTRPVARAIDYLAGGPVEVRLVEEPKGTT
jgi:hypothetical protein